MKPYKVRTAHRNVQRVGVVASSLDGLLKTACRKLKVDIGSRHNGDKLSKNGDIIASGNGGHSIIAHHNPNPTLAITDPNKWEPKILGFPVF